MHRQNYKGRSLAARQSDVDSRNLPEFAQKKKGTIFTAIVDMLGGALDLNKLRSGSLSQLAPFVRANFGS